MKNVFAKLPHSIYKKAYVVKLVSATSTTSRSSRPLVRPIVWRWTTTSAWGSWWRRSHPGRTWNHCISEQHHQIIRAEYRAIEGRRSRQLPNKPRDDGREYNPLFFVPLSLHSPRRRSIAVPVPIPARASGSTSGRSVPPFAISVSYGRHWSGTLMNWSIINRWSLISFSILGRCWSFVRRVVASSSLLNDIRQQGLLRICSCE